MVVEPPQSSLWDVPWRSARLAFVVLEMTGLDSGKDRVIEVCVECVQDSVVVDRLCTLVNPKQDRRLPYDICNIKPEEVKKAPDFSHLASRVGKLLAGSVLVAHAAKYDIQFLAAEYARLGQAFECRHFLDTLYLARRVLPLPSHRLTALASHLAIP